MHNVYIFPRHKDYHLYIGGLKVRPVIGGDKGVLARGERTGDSKKRKFRMEVVAPQGAGEPMKSQRNSMCSRSESRDSRPQGRRSRPVYK